MKRWIRTRGLGIVLALSPALSACGERNAEEPRATEDAVSVGVPWTSGPLVEPTRAQADAASVRAGYIATRQREGAGDARYHVRPVTDPPPDREAWLEARNAEQSFVAGFERSSVKLAASNGSFDVTLRTQGVRCGEDFVALSDAPARVAGGSHRIEMAREAGSASVIEWYANGPLGLEQGFTLASSPCARTEPELALEISVSGRAAVASTDGQAVVLAADGLGAPGLRVRDLYVQDAAGRVLPARFEADRERFAIRIAVAGAAWPVHVDPLVTSQEAKLLTGGAVYGALLDYFGDAVAIDGTTAIVGARLDGVTASDQGSVYAFRQYGNNWLLEGWMVASDAAAGDEFGSSVALQGDSLAVGAPKDGGTLGSAYVFTRTGVTWSQQAKVTPSDAAANDYFGTSVALNGTTLVAGANYKTVSTNTGQGAAYVFERTGTTWGQQAKLTASDGTALDYFGDSASISGTTIAIGSSAGQGSVAFSTWGSVYVYVRNGTTWPQQAKIIASDGANADQLGMSVSLEGNTLVAGAPLANVGANVDQGAAYVFVRSGTAWSQQQKLAVGAAGDRYGQSVALSGTSVVVGAPRRDGALTDQGLAYVYTRSGTVWTTQSTLSVPFVTGKLPGDSDYFGDAVAISGDIALIGAPAADYDQAAMGVAAVFTRTSTKWDNGRLLTADDDAAGAGTSVAISGDTALLGAPNEVIGNNATQGASYVFLRSGTAWAKQARLVASDGAATDLFGSAVALEGNFALIGASSATIAANADQGAAYAFSRSGTTWTQQQKLTASDGAASDAFGSSISLDGTDAVIGAPKCSPGGAASRGAAYVFVRSGTTWSQQQKLLASDGLAGDQLGVSVGVDSGSVVVGAPFADVSGAGDRGAAYAFVRSGTTWSQQQKLTASDGAANHLFGDSAAILGNTAVVGATAATGAMSSTGAAYVFSRTGTTWAQQTKLTASDGKLNEKFGDSVALASEAVLVGASARQNGASIPGQGGTYVYVRSGTAWSERATLVASDGATNDHAGTSVGISGDTALVGAPDDDFNSHSNHGSGYVFRIKGLAGQACGATDQCDANYFCVDGVCCTSACPGPCEVCAASMGAVTDGQCTIKPAGGTPDTSCPGGALCNGSSGGCPGGCTSDSSCPAGSYCSAAGTCLTWRANGQLCNPAADCAVPGCHVCASNFCVDGVCCGTACAGGPCDRCDSPTPGTCSLIPKGGDPQTSCNGYQCNGSSATCGTTCSNNTDCASTHYCASGSCVPKKSKGEDCAVQAECGSGLYCSDGVCCATQCQGKCQACKAANKENGAASGDCEAAKKGTNPGGACVKSTDPCGEQDSCSGTEGVCAVAAFGTSCGPTVCNGTAVSGKVCDGTGTCIDQQNAECAPYVCQSGSCTSPCTSDPQCVSDHYCLGGFCVPKLAGGKACTAASQCSSSFCVDGVCCDSPCTGQCEACAETGSVGVCKVVTGAPRGTRPDCSGTGACKGQCDGANPTTCALPGAGVQCKAGECNGDVAQPPGTCDGSGACAVPTTKNCSPYGCDATAGACKTSCASNADCGQGATCDTLSGQCTTASATCQDAYTVKLANGQTQSCAPYKCVGGACQQQCSTSGDCAPGYACSGAQCVADQDAGTGGGGSGGTSPSGGGGVTGGTGGSSAGASGSGTGAAASGSSGDSGGCGCRVPSSRGGDPRAFALLALGIAALRRRRRRPVSP